MLYTVEEDYLVSKVYVIEANSKKEAETEAMFGRHKPKRKDVIDRNVYVEEGDTYGYSE